MPVKVRCPNCEKTINAPDKARGKSIRCPGCETPIKVPAGDGAAAGTKRSAAKKAGAAVRDDEDFLSGLDTTLEDHKSRICPKCGTDLPEEAVECPKCFVNVETGLISAKAKKKLTKGIDTDLYYRGLLSESWQWLAANPKLVVRTVVYLLLAQVLFLFAGFMEVYVAKWPLKVFWGLILFIAAMVGPGWVFYLDTATIRATMNNKRMSLRKDDGRFDFFQCVALGLQLSAWHLVTIFPLVFGIVGLVLLGGGNGLVGGILIGVGYLLMLPVLAVGMIHMTMPVTLPGWNPLVLFQDFGKTAAAALYWTLFAVLTMLPAAGLAGTVFGVYGSDIRAFIQTANDNASIATAKDIEDSLAGKKTKSEADEAALKFAAQWSQKKEQPLDFSKLTVPAILWVLTCIPFGVAAVFNMRSNGLLGYYYRSDMQLVTLEKEVQFVKKATKEDAEGRPAGKASPKEQAVKGFVGVGGTLLFYVVFNVILYYSTGYVMLPRALAQALRLMQDTSTSAPANPGAP